MPVRWPKNIGPLAALIVFDSFKKIIIHSIAEG